MGRGDYMKLEYVRSLTDVKGLSEEEKRELEKVTEKYTFYSNNYYLSLINWDDPDDPIRKIIIPSTTELHGEGALDPSNESKFTPARGLEHKYGPTALILMSRACGGVCRFCFRKRIFMADNQDAIPDLSAAMNYLRDHKEINNVLLSGGDPLVLPTTYLKTLSDLVSRFSKSERKLYIITDINHPRELTPQALSALNQLMKNGAILANQTPILKGINDSKDILIELFNKLTAVGIPPYYVFQCRPTVGNADFAIPIEKGYRMFEEAKAAVSGLAKRARFIISHTTGKVEVAALTDEYIIFKYHNAAHQENDSRVMIFRRNPEALWLDDYVEEVVSFSPLMEGSETSLYQHVDDTG